MKATTETFWEALENLLLTHKLVIDRPRGQPHPRYPDLIYPLDYGYLEGTRTGDNAGIDVWMGSEPTPGLVGIACTFDTGKSDAEIKLFIGCTPAEVETVLHFNFEHMRYLFIPKPERKE